jgi:hypothetical protein
VSAEFAQPSGAVPLHVGKSVGWATNLRSQGTEKKLPVVRSLQAASLNVAPPLTVPVDKFLEVLLKVAPPLMVPPLSEVS